MQDCLRHVMELCLGMMAEMAEGDHYKAVDHFAAHNRIEYIHFRNVTGKAPSYQEMFVDNGKINMPKMIKF